MKNGLIEAYVKALLETDEVLLDEFSGCGAVAGMTLPLGASSHISPEPKVLSTKFKKRKKK